MENKKIVLLEDDPLLIKMYKDKFATEGFELLAADDGETGLALIKKELPLVIVMDIMMPKKSGLEVLKSLNESETTKNIPAIVLTNLSQENEAKKALQLGAKEYLTKAALTPGEVVAKVKKYL